MLTTFVQPVTAFTGLHVTLSVFRKPLQDFISFCRKRIVFVEPLQAVGVQLHYETFAGIHKPLHISNCTSRTSTSLYEALRKKLTAPNKQLVLRPFAGGI